MPQTWSWRTCYSWLISLLHKHAPYSHATGDSKSLLEVLVQWTKTFHTHITFEAIQTGHTPLLCWGGGLAFIVSFSSQWILSFVLKKEGEKKRSHPNTAATKFKIVVKESTIEFRMVTSFFFPIFDIENVVNIFENSKIWFLLVTLLGALHSSLFLTAPMMGLRFWVLYFGWMLILSFTWLFIKKKKFNII